MFIIVKHHLVILWRTEGELDAQRIPRRFANDLFRLRNQSLAHLPVRFLKLWTMKRKSIQLGCVLMALLATLLLDECRLRADVPAGQNHWAFQRPLRPPVPKVINQDSVQTPIDAFVLARLEAIGLELSPLASRQQLIRRAALDLLGLSPNARQVTRFTRDTSPGAVQRMIERLLASPHYGERWGRHWLDLARYADSGGFEFDYERPHAWYYRDYVISSFNADKPYDRFLVEQLAGDEIASDCFETLVATGFCRNGPTVGNQVLEKNRYDELDDVISTTAEVFLGLTLGCARCHDHKTDPINQRDYYRMLAIFHDIEKQHPLIGTPEQQATKEKLEKEINSLYEKIGQISDLPAAGKWRLDEGQLVQDIMAPNVRLFFGDPQWKDYSVEIEFLKTDGTQKPLSLDAGIGLAFRATGLKSSYWIYFGRSDNREHLLEFEGDGKRVPIFPKVGGQIQLDRWYRVRVVVRGPSIRAWLDDELLFDILDERYHQGGIGLVNWMASTRWRNLQVRDSNGAILLDELPSPENTLQPSRPADAVTRDTLDARVEKLRQQRARLPIAMSITDAQREPSETRIFLRGDYRSPDEVVAPAVPAVLSPHPVSFPAPPESSQTTRRRITFAQWLAAPDNPLTARVMVNRIWQYHFGRGLVDSPSNFGLNGARPSHPDLLDWLAVEFIESGWSIKHMHRLIMASGVYQQDSKNNVGNVFHSTSPSAQRESPLRDPENRLLGRFPRRRLSAEVFRDRILAAADSLNLQMYGPGIHPRIHPSVIATSTTRKWPTVGQEGPQHWRRSVYIFVRRSVLMPFLEVFDAPTTTESCDQRSTTTVPTQALQLMNDAFTNEQSDRMARSIYAQAGSNMQRQVETIYWNSLSRPPLVMEQKDCTEFLETQRAYHRQRLHAGHTNPSTLDHKVDLLALTDLCHVMFNLNEFAYLD